KKKAKKINECIKIYKDIEYKKISFKEEIIITTIGNVVYYKGHHILVEALGKSGYKNFKLNIIGTIVDKEHYSYILDLIEKYNLNNKVNFLGKQENVHKFLEKTSIFVLPSINEGFGIVNLEAALHKLPIIASDLPGIKSFIKENFTGLLFKCGDSNDLSKKIKYIINNESKANELGENAYKELLENYNLEKNSDKFYEFIVKGE
ncbi:glycosyltransferase, partial [Clostridium perfringens]|nr:glycosyltransferase [Clostridium perfringens]